MKKTITIFGSSLPRPGEPEYENAYLIGKILARNGFDICTGGYFGIMEAASKGASEIGGNTIGVTLPQFGKNPNKYLTQIVPANSLFERIQKLIDFADGFIILPGGTGTLLELSAIWEFFNKSFLDIKPALTIGDFWKPIINSMEARIFLENRQPNLINQFDTLEDATNYLIKFFQMDFNR